jgi:hypothetical protein
MNFSNSSAPLSNLGGRNHRCFSLGRSNLSGLNFGGHNSGGRGNGLRRSLGGLRRLREGSGLR